MAVEGIWDVRTCSNVGDDLAGGPQVSTDRESMVSTPGAARECGGGGRAQAGFAGGGRRVLLLGRTPAAGRIECWCERRQGWSTWIV